MAGTGGVVAGARPCHRGGSSCRDDHRNSICLGASQARRHRALADRQDDRAGGRGCVALRSAILIASRAPMCKTPTKAWTDSVRRNYRALWGAVISGLDAGIRRFGCCRLAAAPHRIADLPVGTCGGQATTAERTVGPARMIAESLTPKPGIREHNLN